MKWAIARLPRVLTVCTATGCRRERSVSISSRRSSSQEGIRRLTWGAEKALSTQRLYAHVLGDISSLPRIEVDHPQRSLGRALRIAEMGRQHAQQLAGAAHDGCRLHAAVACGSGDRLVRGELRVRLHVLHDHPFALFGSSRADLIRIDTDTREGV